MFDMPIVSFSIGADCIFLLGGPTRQYQPAPIFLRSGDCMIMGGHQRVAVHGGYSSSLSSRSSSCWSHQSSPDRKKKKGVPRVLSATRFVIPDDRLLSPEEQKMYEYLQSHRINLNVRQVLGDDQRQEVPSEEERKKVFEKAVQASIESEILLSSSSSCSSCCY